jgi:hypothetical protein
VLVAGYFLLDYFSFNILHTFITFLLVPLDLVLFNLLKIVVAAIDLRSVLLVMVIMVENCDLYISFEMQLLYLYLLVTLLLHFLVIIISHISFDSVVEMKFQKGPRSTSRNVEE